MKSLTAFPRIPLAVLPTPIQKLENISRLLGTNVWIKRDDLTGIGLGSGAVSVNAGVHHWSPFSATHVRT